MVELPVEHSNESEQFLGEFCNKNMQLVHHIVDTIKSHIFSCRVVIL